jgi:hypothetical protein
MLDFQFLETSHIRNRKKKTSAELSIPSTSDLLNPFTAAELSILGNAIVGKRRFFLGSLPKVQPANNGVGENIKKTTDGR